MARMSASIPQGTKEYISMTGSQLFNRQHLRSMTVYFGVGEEKPFYLEKSPALLLARLKHNVSFFYLNYFMVTAVLFCLTLLISPSAIIGIGLLALAWTYVIRQSQSGSLKIGGKQTKWSCFLQVTTRTFYSLIFLQLVGISISQTHASIGMGIVSLFVLLYLLSGIFWWTLFSSGFLVAVHASLRDASMHQDGDDKVDMVGEVGEDAAFLGGANSNPV
jgi:hypothetical protein